MYDFMVLLGLHVVRVGLECGVQRQTYWYQFIFYIHLELRNMNCHFWFRKASRIQVERVARK